MRAAIIPALLLAASGSPAVAQTPSGAWEPTANPDEALTSVTARYPSGQAITVRCRAGELNVVISGLPVLEGRTRYVEVTPGGRPTETGFWMTDGETLVSTTPAYSARQLRRGGSWTLAHAVTAESGSALGQHQFDLPPASIA